MGNGLIRPWSLVLRSKRNIHFADATWRHLTSPHVTIPSLVNPTSQTLDACPHPVRSSRPLQFPSFVPNFSRTSLPLPSPPFHSTSHTRTVRSSDTEANHFPSSRQAILAHAPQQFARMPTHEDHSRHGRRRTHKRHYVASKRERR